MDIIKFTEDLIETIQDTQGIEKPKGIYVCRDCNKINNYWERLCKECDERQDREVDEEHQDGLI